MATQPRKLLSAKWTAEQDDLLRGMAEAGKSSKVIAVKLRRTTHSVRTRASLLGVKLETVQARRKRYQQDAEQLS